MPIVFLSPLFSREMTQQVPSRYNVSCPSLKPAVAPMMALGIFERFCDISSRDRTLRWKCIVCLVILTFAYLLRHVCTPYIQDAYPFYTLSVAVTLVACLCGWTQAVGVMLAGNFLSTMFFKDNYWKDSHFWYGQFIYLSSASISIFVIETLRHTSIKYRKIEDELKAREKELLTRAKQQEMVSLFGIASLTCSSFDEWLGQVTEALVKTLQVDFSKVLELKPDKGNFLLRAGHGWEPGVVGTRTIEVANTQAGYTLRTNEPVIVDDYYNEYRFEHGYLLRDYNIVCGISTVIPGSHGPWGILCIHCREKHKFATEDIYYLQCVSNLIGEVLERSKLTGDLQHKLSELASTDRRKDEFLAMLAHELRNPLAPIQNAVKLMEMNSCPDMIHLARDTIGRNLDHMVRLVDDLLDVSRIMRGKIVLKIHPVSAISVIERAIEQTHPLIESMRHSLVFEPSDKNIVLDADPVRMSQIVANLLNNAAKYTEPGGQIRVGMEMIRSNTLEIFIEDNGIGISPELLPYIFDPFTQADQALDRAQGGLGIGLALVRSLIDMHAGTVSATSTIGEGSRFSLQIPARYQGILSAPTSNGTHHRSIDTTRVLVVEDNPDTAKTLGLMLKLDGHSVAVAYNGDDAIVAAHEFKPEVVLLDIGLPGKNGYEVASLLRKEPEFQKICLIAMTGYGRDEDKIRATEAGFDKHLTKPVNYEMVRDLLCETQTIHSFLFPETAD